MTIAKDLKTVVLINDEYLIEIDTMGNHTLYKKKIYKEGNNVGSEYSEIIGYYSSISSALQAMLKQKLVSIQESLTLEEYLYELNKAYSEIVANLDKIGDRITKKIYENKGEQK
jgi:hypothetical protein